MEFFGLRVFHLNHQEKPRKTRSTVTKLLSLNFQRSISRIHGHALSVNHSFPRINQARVPVTYLKLKLNGLIFCWYILPFLWGSVFALGLKGEKHLGVRKLSLDCLCLRVRLYYIDTDEIPRFFLLLKNYIFISRSEDTIFIFHEWGYWCRHGY